jgi:hypothetical protein
VVNPVLCGELLTGAAQLNFGPEVLVAKSCRFDQYGVF